jgi:uncharacterized protein (TIGR01777 family)
MTMNNILITGGTGLIGSHLISRFEAEGKIVSVLSRGNHHKGITSYHWDPSKNEIDPLALDGPTTIIHLAGAGIADRRWTESYKRKIVDSRVRSADLLFHSLKKQKHHIKTFISASAVGYYGDTGNSWVDEDAHPIDSFLGSTCAQWEKSVRQMETLGIRVVILRIGFILDRKGGALPQMAKPVRYYAGAPYGPGDQYVPWIHIEDLCNIFSYAVNTEKMHGVFNAVAPGPVENKFFIRQIARTLGKPVWPMHIPSFVFRMLLGEKADLVLHGQRVSSERVRMAGYRFIHTDVQEALKNILLG